MSKKVKVELTMNEAWSLFIIAKIVLNDDSGPDFWALNGHGINALRRGHDKLETAMRGEK